MGKTLLEFQPNKGDVLPPHKFGTHDVVALKPNKADIGSASLRQGVVYCLKDSSITVAFDVIPEDGLNSPLCLEKLPNEATYRRMKDALIQLSKAIQTGPSANLVPVLFGEKPPMFFSARKHGLVDAAVRNNPTDRTAVIALPGGVGTLDEIFEITALIQLERIVSAVHSLLTNYDSYYAKLQQFLHHSGFWKVWTTWHSSTMYLLGKGIIAYHHS